MFRKSFTNEQWKDQRCFTINLHRRSIFLDFTPAHGLIATRSGITSIVPKMILFR